MLASLPKYAAMVGLAVSAAVAQPALAADSPAPAANVAQPVAWNNWHHHWGGTGAFVGGLGLGLAAGAALGAPYYGYYPYGYYG